jgi:hypothetical protein
VGRNEFLATGDPILSVQQTRVPACEFQQNSVTGCRIKVYGVQIPPPVSHYRFVYFAPTAYSTAGISIPVTTKGAVLPEPVHLGQGNLTIRFSAISSQRTVSSALTIAAGDVTK